MTRFAVYDLVKEALSTEGQSLPLWKLGLAAAVGGGAGGGKPPNSAQIGMACSDVLRSGWESRRYCSGSFSLVYIRGVSANCAKGPNGRRR